MRTLKMQRFTALLVAFMLCLQLGAVSAFATDGDSSDSAPAGTVILHWPFGCTVPV